MRDPERKAREMDLRVRSELELLETLRHPDHKVKQVASILQLIVCQPAEASVLCHLPTVVFVPTLTPPVVHLTLFGAVYRAHIYGATARAQEIRRARPAPRTPNAICSLSHGITSPDRMVDLRQQYHPQL